jgi:DNA-binding transcriptional regulator YiaG
MNAREEADFLRSIGQRVRGLREVRGLSQHRAAELAGMSKSMVARWCPSSRRLLVHGWVQQNRSEVRS